MYRLQNYVLSEDKEKLLSYFSQTTCVSSDIYYALSTADMKYLEIKLSDGKKHKITPGVLSQSLTNNPNQKDRLKAYIVLYYAKIIHRNSTQERFWYCWFKRALDL